MLGKSDKRLNKGEIQRAADRIKKKYDEYSTRFLKSPKLKYAFEERYYKALKEGINMETFLSAEIGAIEELIKKEAVKLKQTIKVQPETQKKVPL